MNTIRTRLLPLSLLAAASLALAGCAGDAEPVESAPLTSDSDAAADTAPTQETADTGDTAAEDAAADASEEPSGEPAPGDLPDDSEDLVTLAVNDLTIECENWCISPEQDQFEAADWDAVADGEAVYQFTVLEGQVLEFEHITPDSQSWPAWQDVIAGQPDGQFVEVQPIVMDASKAECGDAGCEASEEEQFRVEGVRLLYEVSTGEAVYAGITGTS